MLTPTFLLPTALLATGFGLAYLQAALERRRDHAVRSRRPAPPLARELPYWHISDAGIVTGADLTYSAGLSISGIDTDCRSDDELVQIARSLHSTLHVLPAGARLSFHFGTDRDLTAALSRYRAGASTDRPIAERLVADKVAAVGRATGLRRQRLCAFVSLPPQAGARGRLGIGRVFPALTAEVHDEQSQRVAQLRDQVAAGLASAGAHASALDGEATRARIYALLNPGRAQVVPAPNADALPWSDYQTAREQLCLSGLTELPTELVLDGRRLRVITLTGLPSSTAPAMLETLTVSLPIDARAVLSIEVLDDERVLDQLKRRRDQAQALATLRERRNQEAEAQQADVEDLIDEALRGSLRLVRVALTVVLSVAVSADAPARLDQQTADVLRTLSGIHGAQGIVETYGQLDGFVASLPAADGRVFRWHTCTSVNAAHMALAWQSFEGHAAPAVLLETGRNTLVGLDPFSPSLDNPNAFMAGASGAGKSVTTSYLLMHLLAAGVTPLIIDVGGSYRRFVELAGGAYVSLAADADPALNLFYEPADLFTASGQPDPLRLRFMLTALELLVTDTERPHVTNEERAVLDATVRRLYAHATTAPLLSDLVAALQAERFSDPEDAELARRLARRLRYWVAGPYARLLNRPSTVQLTTDFAAFDLKGLPEDVQPIVLLILSAILWNRVTADPAAKKIVVFDEVWTLLSNPASQRLLEELYRTSRKYRTAILSISQSVDDFVDSDIAAALINNSATTYLLRHRTNHAPIADTFHLNARERYVFENLDMRRGHYSEILTLAGPHHFLARVVLTPLEYWISTTHPADVAALESVRGELDGASLLAVVEECARRWPKGAAT